MLLQNVRMLRPLSQNIMTRTELHMESLNFSKYDQKHKFIIFRHNSFTFTEYTKTIASNKQTYLAKTFFILFIIPETLLVSGFPHFISLYFLHKKEGILFLSIFHLNIFFLILYTLIRRTNDLIHIC